MEREDALDEIKKLRERAANIPNTVITSLVGNMIAEEALPSYQTYFSLIFNEDKEVTSDKGWARWSRAWTAEENRHGDLLNKYLYLSGRCDMKKVEQTIHRLIYNGFDPMQRKIHISLLSILLSRKSYKNISRKYWKTG